MTKPTTDAIDARLDAGRDAQSSGPAERPAWRPPTIAVIDAKLTETGVNSTTDATATFS